LEFLWSLDVGIWSFGRRSRPLSRLRFADVDPVLEAFRAFVRFRFDHVNAKTGASQRFPESFFIGRRPEGDAAARLQSLRDSFETAAALEP
jgi:hypothetical protein